MVKRSLPHTLQDLPTNQEPTQNKKYLNRLYTESSRGEEYQRKPIFVSFLKISPYSPVTTSSVVDHHAQSGCESYPIKPIEMFSFCHLNSGFHQGLFSPGGKLKHFLQIPTR
jgi:hypothetical protein